MVSELVSNATRHGGGCLSLDLHAHDGRVTTGAADDSAVLPRLGEADDDGGRGIQRIEGFGCRWGVHDHQGGKRVWVELPPQPDAPTTAAR